MKKSVLFLSFALMVFASVSFIACKNTEKPSEKKSEATEQTVAAEYQCQMKCEGEKTYAEMGACPVCGMETVNIHADSTEQMVMEAYQCPMKCEGEKTYAEMGACPQCGMDLVSTKAESAEDENAHEGHNH